ncbi:hypothetical protein GLOIN_2v1773466 [Rhizophagus irregularis DAOM 181602=DAOM 197198]|uniref:Uncharacterized protein n=1 Tax=Rhizophagus irregularis (strain DAOM 181602 / DAOM 197198 / MUCL 43194) TaxID=747089 RepID=U9UEJ1_RHIID|nr:hypothetical protein GLOIN_2v1773466 [Rhizophagus irregularis DAOM 181602=DAOM 197198]
MSIVSHAVATGWDAYKQALYDNKQEAIGISDLDDSDNSAKDCDTDDIIENMPITSISNPVPILQPELPDVFNNNWATNLGGIPVRWFPANWSLCEQKQREKFQAVVYNILEEVTTSTLWND